MTSPKYQLSLFGTPNSGPAVNVEAEPPSSEALSLAAKLPAQLYLGTSSWSFPGWRGLVYRGRPSKSLLSSHGLGAYASHPLLSAVGVDRSYYAPVGIDEFRDYAAQVPDAFRFLVKAGQQVTSFATPGPARERNALFLDPGWATDFAVRPYIEGLGAKAGVLLFQFPPIPRGVFQSADAFADSLYGFLSALPKGARYAVELRNATLFTPRYTSALRAAGVSHCYNVHPTMPSLIQQRRLVGDSPGPLIIRWMLREGLSFEAARERYAPFDAIIDHDTDMRLSLVRLIDEVSQSHGRIMLIVNNKAEGCSPMSILELARAWAHR